MSNGEVGGGQRFAFVWNRTRDEQSSGALTRFVHEKQRGTQVAVRLNKRVPCIVGCMRPSGPPTLLGLFTRNLSQNSFIEQILQFSEGIHPIIQAIQEQQQ
jgi:hypothetical protein